MQDTIIEALRNNAVEQALDRAREWAQLQPDDTQAHRWLAAAWQQSGDNDAALLSMDRAIALAPEDARLQLLRAGLLIGARQVEEAQSALQRASRLDPNEFGAYLMQAQLALGRGDLDEAERFNRLAARVVSEHPQLAAIDSMLALHRGQPEQALVRITGALQQAPDDLQLRYAAGFVYMGNRHWAFAEQAFRGVMGRLPGVSRMRALLSDLIARQGRPADAADELEPLLADAQHATPALHRLAGFMRLSAGQFEQALPPLRAALAAMPSDPGTLQALMQAWQRLGLRDEARNTLEAALATTTDAPALWQARLALEQERAGVDQVLDRWAQAMPQSPLPWEARLALQQQAGEALEADATAQRILDLDPSHAQARLHVLNGLMARDPALAVAKIDAWLQAADAPGERMFLLGMLGLSHDQAGDSPAAVAAWSEMQRRLAPQRVSPPAPSAPPPQWPALAERPENAPMAVFLWGAPGSGIERIAAVLQSAYEFRGDRLGPQPPQDGLQAFAVVEELANGSVSGQQLVERWRTALPARGVEKGGGIIDWLPWWDNALLVALRPHLREAMLAMVIRDPRDMLLDWLAFGTPIPFALASPQAAAEW
ncbi:MAG TPA: tetratricopeptide repeat protein, partial [Pseudoxanthomonas sp.]|nr:tetratricopeptide repeat protein [Pseudoxanthomonas sp.]